ncbi:MAG: hypothetical protein EPO67_10080 [Reyranella sp.]|nr:MAG: hypothetical protein EPO67_10080 [Reyranella sp.]
MTRLIAWLAALLAAVAIAAGPVAAQNALQIFERDVKPQMELKKFTYGSARPLGDKGFVLTDVVAVTPADPKTGDKEATIRIDKVTVEETDIERWKKPKKGEPELAPRFLKMKLEGISGDDAAFHSLEPYGLPRVPADMAIDYRIDTATKTLTVNKFEMALRGQARLDLSAVIEGVDDKDNDLDGAQEKARLRTGAVTFEDTGGFLAKLLPALAKEEKTTPEAWVNVATMAIKGFATGQGPATQKVLDTLVSFISDWKAPKGPLTITVKPAATTGIGDLARIAMPNALTDVFGVTASYAGTREGASAGGAPMGQPSRRTTRPPAPSTDTDSDSKRPARTPRLTGQEAWNGVVGNTLTGRLDGKTYHLLIRKDGTASRLHDGEIEPGKWKAEDDKVCLKIGDDDRACYTVVTSGRTVTLTDSGGKGFRATLLTGNPRDL